MSTNEDGKFSKREIDIAVTAYVNFRKRLIDDGTLVANGNVLTFSEDTEFPSSSTAAAVVCGGTANGLTVWKNKDGKTLKELESV